MKDIAREKTAAYNIVQARKLYTEPTEKPGSKRKQERTLYKMGALKIPRTMIYSEIFLSLKRTTKPVYIWLMAKEEIIKQKIKDGINDDETRRYTERNLISTSQEEIEKYTNVRADHVKNNLEELSAAGLIRYKRETVGGRTDATVYQLAAWQRDKRGYVKMPIKALLTPAYVNLEHNDKLLFLIMMSQHCSQKKREVERVRELGKRYPELTIITNAFPEFEMAYSQIQKFGIKSSATLAQGIDALKNAGMLEITHGRWLTKEMRETSSYSIKTDFLYKHDNEIKPARRDRYKKTHTEPKPKDV